MTPAVPSTASQYRGGNGTYQRGDDEESGDRCSHAANLRVGWWNARSTKTLAAEARRIGSPLRRWRHVGTADRTESGAWSASTMPEHPENRTPLSSVSVVELLLSPH